MKSHAVRHTFWASMNIFLFAKKKRELTSGICDRHLVKMILEYAQILSTAKSDNDNNGEQLLPSSLLQVEGRTVDKTYKPSHRKHPCVIAVRRSKKAYSFLGRLAIHMCKEYTRFFKKRHASQTLIESLKATGLENEAQIPFKEGTAVGELKPGLFFPCCMDKECIVYNKDSTPNVVLSYRKYYIEKKREMATWTRGRQPPAWFTPAFESKDTVSK